jgi:membrane protein YqaA with SNARE-associated domain
MSLYPQLFLECAGRASIVPFISDTTYFAMKSFGGYNMTLALVLAVTGAMLGQSFNLVLGRYIGRLKSDGKLGGMDSLWFNRLQTVFNRYFVFLLLMSWAPLCNLITVAAGMFGTRYKIALPLLLIGEALHYAFLNT